MKLTDEGIENAVQWTIIVTAIVACTLVVFTVGNVLNQSLMNAGVL